MFKKEGVWLVTYSFFWGLGFGFSFVFVLRVVRVLGVNIGLVFRESVSCFGYGGLVISLVFVADEFKVFFVLVLLYVLIFRRVYRFILEFRV